MAYQEEFVDYAAPVPSATLDNGDINAASIRPTLNGEAATAATLQRADENLRTRTETLRTEAEHLKYLADADRMILAYSGGDVTWGGVAAGGGTGTFTLEALNTLVLRPFLAPLLSTPAQSIIRGIVFKTILVPAGPVNPPRAYSGANKISVELTGSNGATLAVAISGTPANHVLITVDTTPITGTQKAALVTFLTTHINALAYRNLGCTAVLDVGAVGTDLINDTGIWLASDKLRMAGAADSEKHVITAAGLVTFFVDPLNAMIEGDVLAVGYSTFVNGLYGGRRESLNDAPESAFNGVDANLFLVRRFPERLPISIPVAAVINDELQLVDGTVCFKGVATELTGSAIPFASVTVSGSVKLKYAAGTPLDPVVAPIGVNGAMSNVATAGNTAGFTGTGFGSGSGVVGQGGATGPGIYGSGGATSGPGLSGVGSAAGGVGVQGQGAAGGAGASFNGQGAGAGVTATGGATGHGVTATAGAAGLAIDAVGGSIGGVKVSVTGTAAPAINNPGNALQLINTTAADNSVVLIAMLHADAGAPADGVTVHTIRNADGDVDYIISRCQDGSLFPEVMLLNNSGDTAWTGDADGTVFLGTSTTPWRASFTRLHVVTPSAVTWNSASPSLTTSVIGARHVTLGASAAGNPTFFPPDFDGQRLLLMFVAVNGGSTLTIVDNAGLKVAGTFTPALDATIEFVYNATLGYWLEVSRSMN